MLASREFQVALTDKLDEEVAELIAARTTDAVNRGAADVVEVLIAVAGECIRNSRLTHRANGDGRVRSFPSLLGGVTAAACNPVARTARRSIAARTDASDPTTRTFRFARVTAV